MAHTPVQGLDIFDLPEYAAYGVKQAFSEGAKICYGAVSSVCAAATPEASALGNLVLEQVDTGVLVWRNPILGAPHTIVHIVNAAAVDAVAARMGASAQKFLSMFSGELGPPLYKAKGVRDLERSQLAESTTNARLGYPR